MASPPSVRWLKKLAYVFQVNARGARADGVISPGYVNPNTGSAVDYSWNGYWRAVVKRDAGSWTAEIEIDVRSLQFSDRQAAWGLNVSRYVPRLLLTLAWSGISLDAQATDLQREGRLTGTSGLEQGSGFEFDPYAVARYDDGQGAAIHAGFDVKVPLQGTTQSGWYGYIEVNPSYELLTAPYEIVPGIILPPGEYRFTNFDIGVQSPASRACWVVLEGEAGQLYDGHYLASYPALNLSTFGGRLNAALQPALIWLHGPQGRGSVRAQRLKLAYSFTPDLTLRGLVQYDSVTRAVSTNTLLEWIIRPNRTLHVVWNHGLTLNPNLLQGRQTLTGTSVVVKLDWGFF